ncbi:hypothetical protein ACIRPQ_21810 [Streptomyces sp. NPDC101213]|uniref:hypothetical protein n=1 Tax=Streptomyces sp. NPDC101213 TaxID=3366130 RepID=UPI00381B72EE
MLSAYLPDALDVPPEQALLVVDMKGYSQIPEADMAPTRADLDMILDTVLEQSKISDARRLETAVKDRGDGAIFVLPSRHAARLVDPFLTYLGHALGNREQSRLDSAPVIQLRASVHVGPLEPPDHRGGAANDACRLVDSDAARQAMAAAEANRLLLAAAVSDTVFRHTVRAGRTRTLKQHQFHRATARVDNKPGFEETCWLFVPGLVPAVISPYLTGDGSVVAPGEQDQARQHRKKDKSAEELRAEVRPQQKGKASGKSRLVQVGRDYISGEEQS